MRRIISTSSLDLILGVSLTPISPTPLVTSPFRAVPFCKSLLLPLLDEFADDEDVDEEVVPSSPFWVSSKVDPLPIDCIVLMDAAEETKSGDTRCLLRGGGVVPPSSESALDARLILIGTNTGPI